MKPNPRKTQIKVRYRNQKMKVHKSASSQRSAPTSVRMNKKSKERPDLERAILKYAALKPFKEVCEMTDTELANESFKPKLNMTKEEDQKENDDLFTIARNSKMRLNGFIRYRIGY